MSIPKVISYCWFGKNPLPDNVKKCIDSWKKYCPDYKIIEWNEDNYDVKKIPYIRDAYNEKKWAFVSDFARLDIINTYGGIYLDTDVELIKPLDALLDYDSFWAIEKGSLVINTGLGFGSQAGNVHLEHMIKVYEYTSFYKENGKLNTTPCTFYTTEYFKKIGYKNDDIEQNIRNAMILPSSYFCPMSFYDGTLEILDNTIGIHWYDMSWLGESDKKIHEVENKIKKNCPLFLANKFCWIYRKSYRLIEYSKKGTLFEKIRWRGN